jgi:hypothetical protein
MSYLSEKGLAKFIIFKCGFKDIEYVLQKTKKAILLPCPIHLQL